MMECLQAQEILSVQRDGESIAPEDLGAARAHASTCERCASFVAALDRLEQHGDPVIRESTVAAILAAVDEVGSRQPGATATVTESATATARMVPVGAVPARTWSELIAHALSPQNRTAVTRWVAAAAVIFVVAGIGAVVGGRAILAPSPQVANTAYAPTERGVPESGATLADPYSAPDAAELKSSGEPTAAPPVATLAFVVLNGSVYRLAAPAATLPTDVGYADVSIRSALDATAVRTLGGKLSEDGSALWVSSTDITMQFDRVEREFAGTVFVLKSGPLDHFGLSAAWPPSVPLPTGEDGGVRYESVGVDPSGAQVFALRGRGVDGGIALRPPAAQAEAVSGSTGWTWWEPLR